MEKRIKQITKRIFIWPFWIALLISVPGFIMVGYALNHGFGNALDYVSYMYSSYGLVVLGFASVKGISEVARRLRNSAFHKWLQSLPVIGRLMCDTEHRIRVSLYLGGIFTWIYAFLKITTGIVFNSLWLLMFGCYYVLIGFLKIYIIDGERRYSDNSLIIDEYRRYLKCGIVLLVIDSSLVPIIDRASALEGVIEYPGYLIYGMAAYSFYAVIVCIVNAIKFKGYYRPMFSAARICSLTGAMVSMLSLEIAMTARFGETDTAFRKYMTAVTGGLIIILVMVMALMMLLRSRRFFRHN